MKLDDVVPWGRSRAEYELMFDLTSDDYKQPILGCGDGPASFNAQMTAAGYQVISVDPLYAFDGEAIQGRVDATYEAIISQVKQNSTRYRWTYYRDADALGRARLAVMERFLADYETGRRQGRYLPDALPTLTFADGRFGLALCSHLLFLYSEQLSLDFHLASLRELLRVAHEVRVFPLLALDCRPSPYLAPVQAHFTAAGYEVEIRRTPYEFQVGGYEMMRIAR
jgi:hypothetical protein